MITNIGVKKESNGSYTVDFGIEGNNILKNHYMKFVDEVKAKRPDLSEEERNEILQNEDDQNCRLIREWLGQLLVAIKAQEKLDEENKNVLVNEPPKIENECEVFVSNVNPEEIKNVEKE
jgi:hypothetical protein